MQVRSAREQAVDAARRATMMKTTFASIRHLLDGNEFMPTDDAFSPATAEENENPFAFFDQQFTKQELTSFKESGSEDDSINDFNDPFQTDDFYTSFPTFNPQSSVVTTDQSISDSKGLLSADEDFGFEEADFESNFFNETGNNSNGSSNSHKDRSSRDRLSKRLNSSTRSRRKPDKSHDGDNISATENTEISNGSSMKRSMNSSDSGQRRTIKLRNGDETDTPRDDALLTSPRVANRRRKSKSGIELLSPRKADSRPMKADPGSTKSRKNGDKEVKSKPGSMDLLKALASELMQKSPNGDEVDAAILTERIVTRVKELQASRPSKEPVSRRCRSRSRGRLDKFDEQRPDEKIRSSSKEKRSRSRSRSRPRLKALSPPSAVKSKKKEDVKPPSRTSSKNSKDPHSSHSKGLFDEIKSPKTKARRPKGDLDETLSPPAGLLDAIKSPKTKSKRSKGTIDTPRSPPVALLDEIKSPKTKSRGSKGILDSPRSPPAALLDEIKSPKTKSRRSKGILDSPRSPPAALLDEIKSPKRSLKSKSKSKETRSTNSSDDEIIEVLAKLINQQLSASD